MHDVLGGDAAFRLYDTFGVPFDFIEDTAATQGVTVDKDGTITLSYTATNQVPSNMLYDKLKSMLGHLDMHEHLIPRDLYLKNDIGVAGVAHQSGTCKFGTDPATSALEILSACSIDACTSTAS